MEATVQGTGPVAVVLLHGQPGTADDWQWVTPLLEDRYTTVVPDRPGYGRTPGPATGFRGNASALARLLDRLEVERAVVVGHSWAGGAALAFAAGHPDRAAGLVLVSSVGPGERLGWSDRLLAAPVVGDAIAAATVGGVGLVLGIEKVQSVAERRLGGRAHDALVALTRLTRPGSRVWRSFVTEQRCLLSELDGLADDLPALTAPTVVLHGRADRMVPVEVAATVAAAIPGAELQVLEGVGHLLPHDRPEAVAAAVARVADPAGS